MYTPKLTLAAFAVITALLLLLSIDSPAAYRFRKNDAQDRQSAPSAPAFTLLDNKKPIIFEELSNINHYYSPGNSKEKFKNPISSELALIFGGVAFLSFVAGFGLIHTVQEPYSAAILILAWGLFGILLPAVFGALAITHGVKGIKAKRKKNMAIAGLVMGILGIVLGVFLVAL